MRYLLFIILLVTFSCSQTETKEQKDELTTPISTSSGYQYDSLYFDYPNDWELAENIDVSGSNLITIKPKDSLQSGVISVVVFKAELPKLNTLLSMKGSVYLSLDIDTDAITEDEAREISYQNTTAVFQAYQVNLNELKLEGQFIVFNKSGRCYILFFQSKAVDKQRNSQIFDAFEKSLEIR